MSPIICLSTFFCVCKQNNFLVSAYQRFMVLEFVLREELLGGKD